MSELVELRLLDALFAEVRAGCGGTRPGRCLSLSGTTALVEGFAEQNGASASFFTASPTDDASVGIDSLVMTSLPDRAVFAEPTPGIWRAALRLIADILPADEPSIVVIDEVQRLLGQGDAFEEILQAVWDRSLSRKPVLLILIGSDAAVMKTINSRDRPFYGRGKEMVLETTDV
ncbi:hypothetical protein [Winogradskya humida]|uniref:AAA domain-containing protein n=1 Tax=Winogradskya humida TaxID=113566 RepID=A0ABQ3ZQI9_9ACTN|nr:hypothetical protein [Actinoplanes humidus]GIE20846.1 hypothetical protein Ahu01nite_039480 [Actinoplanes humidus]